MNAKAINVGLERLKGLDALWRQDRGNLDVLMQYFYETETFAETVNKHYHIGLPTCAPTYQHLVAALEENRQWWDYEENL